MKIIGLEKIISKLDDLGRKKAKSLARKALRQGAKLLQNKARAEAPERSGLLRRNIRISGGRGKPGAVTLRVSLNTKGPAFYGKFVLGGYRVGNRKLGDARTYVAPNDFMGRAFDEEKESAVTKTTDTLKDLIEGESE